LARFAATNPNDNDDDGNQPNINQKLSSAVIPTSPDMQQYRNNDHAKDCPSENANLCRGHRAVPWSRWPNGSRLNLQEFAAAHKLFHGAYAIKSRFNGENPV
jgi:hypothetical protein